MITQLCKKIMGLQHIAKANPVIDGLAILISGFIFFYYYLYYYYYYYYYYLLLLLLILIIIITLLFLIAYTIVVTPW